MSVFFTKLLMQVMPLIIAVVLHEISHGITAYALGDDTAKRAGRFKLHTHFDMLGSFIIPFGLYLINSPFLIGYAKPVPVNPKNFENETLDMAIVAIAGPLCNAFLAVLSALLLRNMTQTPIVIQQLIVNFMIVNLVLCFFNLIPIPPLDGSRIVAAMLPKNIVEKFYKLEPFGFIIIITIEMISIQISNIIGINLSLLDIVIRVPVQKAAQILLP